MADGAPVIRQKRTFRKYTYRGVDLDALLQMKTDQLAELFAYRQRRKLMRGSRQKQYNHLLKKLRKAKKNCKQDEKPAPVKTHLRDMTVLPEMVGSIVGVYNGKIYNQVYQHAIVKFTTLKFKPQW